MAEENQDNQLDTGRSLVTSVDVESDRLRSRIIIDDQITRWGILTSAFAVFFLFLSFWEVAGRGFPITVWLAPLLIHDFWLIMIAWIRYTKDRLEEAPNLYIKDMVENLCTALFKLLLIAHYASDVPFLIWSSPALFSTVFRLAFVGLPYNDCWSFSGGFRYIGRWTRLITLIFVGTKIDGLLDWPWISILWPCWIILCLSAILTIGVLLLVIGSLWNLNNEMNENRKEIWATGWLFMMCLGFSATFTILTVELGFKLGSDESLLLPFLWCFIFWLIAGTFTIAFKRRLVDTWDFFFNEEGGRGNHSMAILPAPSNVQHERPTSPLRLFSFIHRIIPKPPKQLHVKSGSFFERPTTVIPPDLAGTVVSPSVGGSHENSFASKQWLVCESAECTGVIMECGHGGVCFECAILLWKNTGICHLCREPISQVLRVEVSPLKTVQVISTTTAKNGNMDDLVTRAIEDIPSRDDDEFEIQS